MDTRTVFLRCAPEHAAVAPTDSENTCRNVRT